MVAALALAAGRNLVAPGRVPWIGAPGSHAASERGAPPGVGGVETGSLQEIGLDQVMSLVAGSGTPLLDARDAAAYDRGHIPGALSVPLDAFDESWPDVLDALPAGAPVITYCSGPGCDLSYDLAQRLLEEGIGEVYDFAGGMSAWREQGLPVETGPGPPRAATREGS